MRRDEVGVDLPEYLRAGELIRTSSLRVLMGAERWEDLQATYRCKKGARFVLLLLGTESGKPGMDEDSVLASLGFTQAAPKKRGKR